MPNFLQILPVGAELFHVDRQADMTKLIVACCNFANAPKNLHLLPSLYTRLLGRQARMSSAH